MRVLTLLVALALALRVWGLAFGLPYTYHVDESVFNGIARQAAETRFRDLPPNFSGFQLIVIVEHALLTMVEPAVRALRLPAAIVATLDSPSERYNLVARVNSAVLGSLAVVPVFLVGRRLWHARVGWLAALFTATCYMLVRDSHYGVPDVTAGCLAIAAAWAALRLADGAGAAAYVLAGALAGLATGTKPLAWPIFALPILYHGSAPFAAAARGRAWIRRLIDWRLWLALAAGAAAYLICAPQTVLHWAEFRAYWHAAQRMGARGGMDRLRLEDTGPLGTYIYSLRWGLGEALFVLSAAGLVVSAIRGPRAVRILAIFPVAYVAFLLLPGNMFFARYVIPALPFLLLPAAAIVSTALSALPRRQPWYGLACAAIVAAVVAEPVIASLRHDVLLTRTDTRTLAKAWIEEHVPEGAGVMLEFYWFSPQLSSPDQPAPFSTHTYQVMSRGAYGLSDLSNGFGPSQGTPAVSDYAAMGVDYIVSNSYSRGSTLLDAAEDRAKRAFYEDLDTQATLVHEVSPYVAGAHVPRIFAETYGPAIGLSKYERPGPVIRIYQLARSPLIR